MSRLDDALLACAASAAMLLSAQLAGCTSGTSAKQRYEQQFRAVMDRFDSKVRAQDLGPRTPASEFGTKYNRIRLLFLKAAGEIGRLKPPRDVASAQRDFVRGFRAFATGKALAIATALARGDEDAARRAAGHRTAKDVLAARLVHRARNQFRAKHYQLGPLTEAGVMP